MTKLAAYSEFLALCERHGADLNQLLLDFQGKLPDEEFSTLRRIVANILGHGYFDAFHAIAKEVPELTPAWMKSAP